VLIINDEQHSRRALQAAFGEQYQLHFTASTAEVLAAVVCTRFDVLVTDHHLAGMNCHAFLRELDHASPHTMALVLVDSSLAVLVLSGDATLCAALATNTEGRYPLHPAADEADALAQLARLAPAVVVIDAACCETPATLAAQVHRYQPSAVVIIAAERKQASAHLGLVGQHGIARVLLKPLSPGQSRLCLEASVRLHLIPPRCSCCRPGSRLHRTPRAPAPIGSCWSLRRPRRGCCGHAASAMRPPAWCRRANLRVWSIARPTIRGVPID
jgi:DNA-binding NtrC family response regulator